MLSKDLVIAIIFFVLFSILFSARSAPTSEVIFTQLEAVTHDKEFVKVFDFQLVPQNGRNLLNGSFMYGRNLKKLNLRFILDFEKPDKTRFQMLDLKADFCKLLKTDANKPGIVKVIMQQLGNQSLFIDKCPLEANKSYDLLMLDMHAPQFPLPNIKFLATIFFFSEDGIHKITEFRVRGALKNKP